MRPIILKKIVDKFKELIGTPPANLLRNSGVKLIDRYKKKVCAVEFFRCTKAHHFDRCLYLDTRDFISSSIILQIDQLSMYLLLEVCSSKGKHSMYSSTSFLQILESLIRFHLLVVSIYKAIY